MRSRRRFVAVPVVLTLLALQAAGALAQGTPFKASLTGTLLPAVQSTFTHVFHGGGESTIGKVTVAGSVCLLPAVQDETFHDLLIGGTTVLTNGDQQMLVINWGDAVGVVRATTHNRVFTAPFVIAGGSGHFLGAHGGGSATLEILPAVQDGPPHFSATFTGLIETDKGLRALLGSGEGSYSASVKVNSCSTVRRLEGTAHLGGTGPFKMVAYLFFAPDAALCPDDNTHDPTSLGGLVTFTATNGDQLIGFCDGSVRTDRVGDRLVYRLSYHFTGGTGHLRGAWGDGTLLLPAVQTTDHAGTFSFTLSGNVALPAVQ